MRRSHLFAPISICILLSMLPVLDCWWMLSNDDASMSCATVPGLSAQQRRMCREHPQVIKYLVGGLRTALYECQNAFKTEAWNCTLDAPGVGTAPLKIASKESAYVYAISAAGVSHALSKACSKGLINECGCGDHPTSTSTLLPHSYETKDFIWSGCSDNVKFGNQFGRRFVDQYDKQHSEQPRSKMNLHNNRVGRRILTSAMRKECKCHGVSGSCVTKTCWKVVPKFDEFAAKLLQKYQAAQHVEISEKDQKMFVRRSAPKNEQQMRSERYLKPVEHISKDAMKNELIYLETSPNYCAIDVKDRECGENCRQICCGRGWRTTREIVDEPCHCQFVWCCEVKCKTCKKLQEKNYCL
ncbi:unnamed protein product [Caenorhabditis angaria]|uniref:Protein Wnt n=1 Tax=Caenorhabditis angaria TaxID=860376 RepID=A0A9P1IYJ6_9PELO|nr:unnamed protein product [Caenorhabditis angaria]